jgi:polyhydroxyalkanoate synthesis regulator phasin
MFETLDKIMLAGLGAISMTRERAEKLFEDYVSKGKAEKEGKSGFVKDVMNTAERTRSELEKIISEQVDDTVKKLNLATREDIVRLEKKVDKILHIEKEK